MRRLSYITLLLGYESNTTWIVKTVLSDYLVTNVLRIEDLTKLLITIYWTCCSYCYISTLWSNRYLLSNVSLRSDMFTNLAQSLLRFLRVELLLLLHTLISLTLILLFTFSLTFLDSTLILLLPLDLIIVSLTLILFSLLFILFLFLSKFLFINVWLELLFSFQVCHLLL